MNAWCISENGRRCQYSDVHSLSQNRFFFKMLIKLNNREIKINVPTKFEKKIRSVKI